MTTTSLDAAASDAAAPPAPQRQLLVATSLGSAIEHYDFFSYAFLAPLVFSEAFFPKLDGVAGTMAVYATFAVGFAARPLGGLVFGHLGDRIGRKSVLMATLLLMGLASFLIGCLPTYATLGLWAPGLLVALRFVQGFAFGGEYMNAVTLNVESAPPGRRGFFASWINASGPIGIIAASGLIALLTAAMGRESFQTWGWRVPFLLSIVMVLVGSYVRHQVDESLLFRQARSRDRIARVPVLEVWRAHKRATVLAALVNMVHSSFQYLCTVFVLGVAVRQFGVSAATMTTGATLANVVEMIAVPVLALVSDRIGRRPLLLAGIALAALWFPLYFQLVANRDVLPLIAGLVFAVGIVHALIFAPEAAFTAELFPTEVRVTGGSLGKQLGIVLGGGCAPLIATRLMDGGTSFLPVVGYFEVIAVLAFIAVLVAPENARRAL